MVDITFETICPKCGEEILILNSTKQKIVELLKKDKRMTIWQLHKAYPKIAYANLNLSVHQLEKMKILKIEKEKRYNQSWVRLK